MPEDADQEIVIFLDTHLKNWILTNGGPLRLQKIIGHSTLAMVQHYANIYKADLKEGFDEHSVLSTYIKKKIKA